MRKSLSILALLAVAASSIAETAIFKSTDHFLKTIDKIVISESVVARGDLNNDQREDVAILLITENDFRDKKQQLVVLLQNEKGLFSVAAKTDAFDLAGMGCCWVDSLEIKKASVFIRNFAKTACSSESATHQFKLYNGIWQLIGIKITSLDRCENAEISNLQDTNLLTGKTIYTTQISTKKPSTKIETRNPQLFLLKDYDFDNGFGAP